MFFPDRGLRRQMFRSAVTQRSQRLWGELFSGYMIWAAAWAREKIRARAWAEGEGRKENGKSLFFAP